MLDFLKTCHLSLLLNAQDHTSFCDHLVHDMLRKHGAKCRIVLVPCLACSVTAHSTLSCSHIRWFLSLYVTVELTCVADNLSHVPGVLDKVTLHYGSGKCCRKLSRQLQGRLAVLKPKQEAHRALQQRCVPRLRPRGELWRQRLHR